MPLQTLNADRIDRLAALNRDGFDGYMGTRNSVVECLTAQIDVCNTVLGGLTACRSQLRSPSVATSHDREAWNEAEKAIIAAEKAVLKARPAHTLERLPYRHATAPVEFEVVPLIPAKYREQHDREQRAAKVAA